MKNTNEIRTLDIQTITILSSMGRALEDMILEGSRYMLGSEKLKALGDCIMLKELNDAIVELAEGLRLSAPIFSEATRIMDDAVFCHTDTMMNFANHVIPFFQNPLNLIRFDGDALISVNGKIESIISMMENIILLREKIEIFKKGESK